MKRILLASAIALAGLSGAALAQSALPRAAQTGAAQPLPVQLSGAERTAALTAASAALNRNTSLQGRFTQTAPDGGVTRGKIYLQKPGRLRFEYDAPTPLLIVADGATVAVEDKQLKDVSRVPLRSTPLFYVLKRDINLERDARITRVARQGGTLLVTARDRTGEAEGEITLSFDTATYALTRWEIVDAQRQVTRINLSEVRAAPRLDPRLFRLQDARDPTARKRT
jgi:outer membrane lipoprotein-sorting protein